MSRVPTKVRKQVRLRDGDRCCICGQHVRVPHIHHRIPRGMGGTSLADHCRLSNLLTLCHRCHLGNVERNRSQALDFGWLVSRGIDPAKIPVLYRSEWVVLHDDGSIQTHFG